MTVEHNQTETLPAETASPHPLKSKTQRKKWLLLLLAVLLLIAFIYVLWRLMFAQQVSTDNAYVAAENAEITSMVTGQVAEIKVSNTAAVRKGDLLARIDPRDAHIALAQAEAELAKTQRLYQQTAANSRALDSQVLASQDDIQAAKAQVLQAEASVKQAMDEFRRRQQLAISGAISQEELSKASTALTTAQANLNVAQATLMQAQSKRKAAQSNLEANQALIMGAEQNDSPDVLAAKARVAQARLELQRTEIYAPIDGIVANRSIQVGQRVAPGSKLMLVVPIQQLYVDANFKESQLQKVKVGQKATLTADLYGDKVIYDGIVQGFSGGTGAAFALIPAQNATGNWIKVVQRLPVRIQLDPQQLAQHPLRVGLSMNVTVDLASASKDAAATPQIPTSTTAK
ncbi:HlyD family efflux transporter periplasmic adaptor subunit [Acinetobacter larvae]|uniref:Efflux transporter periplasmic adaptor subunit n=1 Tax=Acinetobacter larvae TaxID=1789224 RepID=A0A1B2M1J5_9GAMM|nr:HlyD family efflux transporter periplasmic adaptor subunit [Acinetobacter larvae]AOA59062.1 efflux transporter periplasmic adaptor subunit [Acinetobacter larvae]